tara:strand:+ start:639 stop:776 length:138 start_codon:yes stop_codon:yes gene_type:complete
MYFYNFIPIGNKFFFMQFLNRIWNEQPKEANESKQCSFNPSFILC